MKLKFNVNSKIEKKDIIEKTKLVLFNSMVKMHELANIYVPVDTGRLKTSIKLFPSIPGAKSYVLADGVTYGIDVEFGTAPHIIRPRTKKALKFKSGGKDVFAKKVKHPGTPAQPFFRPALDQVKKIWMARYMERDLGK